jgi:septum formation protein
MYQRKILLASGSPRRKQLLEEAGFDVRVAVKPVDEVWPDDLPPARVAEYLADLKGQAALDLLQAGEILIAADTTVVLHDRVLNKPADAAEAADFLSVLSGRRHQVYTGVFLSNGHKSKRLTEKADVWFEPISDDEIDYYIRQYKPFDKAGAYAIQEWIGLCKVRKISGTMSNIMGLPVSQVYKMLHKHYTNGDFTGRKADFSK